MFSILTKLLLSIAFGIVVSIIIFLLIHLLLIAFLSPFLLLGLLPNWLGGSIFDQFVNIIWNMVTGFINIKSVQIMSVSLISLRVMAG